jgi:predicted DNA-binding transcriptional regulator YafY
MDAEDVLARTVRLARIPRYLQTHPKGLTTKELAGLCGVCCRTIQRDLYALQIDLRLPILEKDHRYMIMGDYILPPVSFSLYESVALFMASRLALRQADECNPHLQTALLKMAKVLPYPLDEKIQSSAAFIGGKKDNRKLVNNFEKIAFAWMAQRRIVIDYHSLQSNERHLWELDPYFMEMTGVGYSSYVIGHAVRADKDGIFTFKLERIKKARLTTENFDIPANIDIEKLLSTSWGVIWGNDVEVILRFTTKVTRRVKESIWHPSQVISDLTDGGCQLKLKIGSLMEIAPWIRSWGPDVEVLSPPELREQFGNWANELNAIYRKRKRSSRK